MRKGFTFEKRRTRKGLTFEKRRTQRGLSFEKRKTQGGLTLIEMLLAVGIFSLLFYLSSVSFVRIQRSRLLSDNAWQVGAIIREAQSRALSGEAIGDDHLYFGVLFKENSYQEFATLSDFSNREQIYDLTTNLPSSLHFLNFNLPDNCLGSKDCLIFSPIEGTPSASASIILEDLTDGDKKTILINQEGKVSF